MTARLCQAVAVARNGVIGAEGGLAWKISDDLKSFKAATIGKPIIMGRKTFDSIGRPLPGRDNIVVTRAPSFSAEGTFIARTIEGAIKLARGLAAASGADEIAIIGGAEIYAQTLARTQRIYLTRVDADVEGDVRFPEIDSRDWAERLVGACEKNDRNEHACQFFILDRRSRIPAKER
ncbi:dihydrofolate reductase [Marinicaulis aureus]|uniref:Dihydrofolate reductase n=1 Tax=Hyphococcus aureus TaxID=2666033 RepID=A0ABW1KZI4_9PROT